jgi:hypothetical protein
MKLADVHNFFEQVARRMTVPARVVITGGAAAIAFGVSRATEDIDFEVELTISPAKHADAWKTLESVLRTVQTVTGIAPQFSEDIDRWSAIALPSKRSKRLWKFGAVDVQILHPLDWSVGKLARYMASDESDVVTVFKKKAVSAPSAARVWGQALGLSPASSAQTLFRNNVKSFFDQHALALWGPSADPKRLFETFLKTATSVKRPSRR